MPSFQEILLVFLLPPCVCGAILLAAARSSSDGERRRGWNAAAGAWALGIGYLCAHLKLVGFPAWPSAERTPTALDWLGWTVLVTLPCAALYLTNLGERWVSRILRALLTLAVFVSLRTWMQSSGPPWTAALFLAVVLVVWAGTDALVERSPGPVAVLPLFVAMCCASVSSLLGHSALVAELAGSLCACLGACAVVARIAPRFQLSPGAVAVFMFVFAGVLLNGVFFSDVHWSSALFSCLALLAPWIHARSASSAHSPWKAAAVRAAIAAVFGAAAIAAAHLQAPSYEY